MSRKAPGPLTFRNDCPPRGVGHPDAKEAPTGPGPADRSGKVTRGSGTGGGGGSQRLNDYAGWYFPV